MMKPIIIIEPERVQGPDVALVVTVERHVLATCTSVQIPARHTHTHTRTRTRTHAHTHTHTHTQEYLLLAYKGNHFIPQTNEFYQSLSPNITQSVTVI